jgi:hypothetical protein
MRECDLLNCETVTDAYREHHQQKTPHGGVHLIILPLRMLYHADMCRSTEIFRDVTRNVAADNGTLVEQTEAHVLIL